MAKNNFKRILLPATAALAYWVGDAAIDTLVFREGPFVDRLLFGVSGHELYSRSLVILCIIAVGFVMSRIFKNRNIVLEALRESEETLHTITDAAKDAIIMMDARGNISFWNASAEKIFGYPAREALGRELHVLLGPQRYHEASRAGIRRFQGSGEGPAVGRTIELTARRKDGTEFPVELSLSALQRKGQWHAVGVVRDITARKMAEEELRSHREELEHLVSERTEELNAVNELLRKEIDDRSRTEEELYRSESFLNAIFDSFHDPFSIFDRDFRIIKFNDAYARMRDKLAKDLYGKKCFEVLHSRPCVCEDCIIEKTFQSKDPCAKEKLFTLPDGSQAWFEIYTYPIFDQDRNVTHVVEYSRDITDRKKEEEEKKELIKTLNYLSTTDALTGLFNRRALNDTLRHEIDRAVRYDADLSLILCDVDKFKLINDTFGHTAGDRALKSVADTLQRSLRRTDILGRYGGDEFMVILPETSLEGARNLAEKIRASVEGLELAIDGKKKIALSISIGVASCCAHRENIDTLVSLADNALYLSKEAGRNKVSIIKR